MISPLLQQVLKALVQGLYTEAYPVWIDEYPDQNYGWLGCRPWSRGRRYAHRRSFL